MIKKEKSKVFSAQNEKEISKLTKNGKIENPNALLFSD